MSDLLTHECGVAAVRLLKPLGHFASRYGTALHAFNKLFLLMEKQHNRGQDGAGIGCLKLEMPPGAPYMERERDNRPNALHRVFEEQMEIFHGLERKGLVHKKDAAAVKEHFPFGGEILVGHLRYGTSGGYGRGSCHPYYRRSNYTSRALMVLGNFNMTNTQALNDALIARGQHPVFDTDTQTVLEEIGYHLDQEHFRLRALLLAEGFAEAEAQRIIARTLDLRRVLEQAAKVWDGGYTILGLVGHGDVFALRDPAGIRPCHYLRTDELVAVASERAPLMTVFEAEAGQVQEVPPGHVLTVKADGEIRLERFAEPRRRASCSFERIYFSRGNDPEIYNERRALGRELVPAVVEAIGGDFDRAIFSYIPNTAEVAYYGLLAHLRLFRRQAVKRTILQAHADGTLDEGLLDRLILHGWPRSEKVALKDHKMRTFITQESNRKQLVSHVYDITYGVVGPEDYLVVLDDSIVRGTTLRDSIIRILARTRPRELVIVSTAPQIRYPDCYGIDMSELGKFVAFQAVVKLLEEAGRTGLLADVAAEAEEELRLPTERQRNVVQRVYQPFTAEEIAARIARLVTPADLPHPCPVRIVYQTVEGLHRAIPGPYGDWYFTGDYPTPGGTRVANLSYLQWYHQRAGRVSDAQPSAAAAPVAR